MLKLLSLGLASAFLVAAPASAADYLFNITGISTASGTLTVQDTPGQNGGSLITAISGTYNGQAIQSLAPTGSYGNNDNLLFIGQNALLDGLGFTFNGAFGTRNIYSNGGNFGEGGQGIGVGYRDYEIGDVTFSIAPVTGAVPEPATWALMLMGFGGIGLAMRRRQTATPALQAA